MSAIITFEADNKIYLLTNRDHTVAGFDSVEQGLGYFEKGYKRSHGNSYESSMSACINFISFRPAVHEWEHEDLSPLIKADVIVMDTFREYGLRNISGFMTGALLTGEKAREFHEGGKNPSLI